MKKWIQNLKEKINDRIERAYGFDELVTELIIVGMAFVLFDLFYKTYYLSLAGIACLIVGCIRCYSSNIEARKKELQIYQNLKISCSEWLSAKFERIKDRVAYKYVVCPHCGTVIKLPRGMGKVDITCPKCNNKFMKRV